MITLHHISPPYLSTISLHLDRRYATETLRLAPSVSRRKRRSATLIWFVYLVNNILCIIIIVTRIVSKRCIKSSQELYRVIITRVVSSYHHTSCIKSSHELYQVIIIVVSSHHHSCIKSSS